MILSELDRFIVGDAASVRDAMSAINDNFREVVLVSRADRRIVGVITDGDIRRALLRGATMDSPASEVMSRDFVSATAEMDRAAVLDLMKALHIRHVPVLRGDGTLQSIHFLEDIIGAPVCASPAVIMAGGRGVRLLPITQSCPKPMVPVAGRPILERIVLHLVGCGVRHIFLSINYLGHMIEDHFGDGTAFGCRIEYLRETTELGTGGALRLLPQRPRHPLLVLNGDQVSRIDVQGLLARHAVAGVRATMAVGSYQHQVPFGVVHEQDGRLMRIEEKPSLSMLVNRGVYVLEPDVLDLIPQGQSFPITDLFDRLLERGEPVGTYFSDDEWLDVGRPADLLRANGLA
jgi:dTDP-glucose pyrophosphorylase